MGEWIGLEFKYHVLFNGSRISIVCFQIACKHVCFQIACKHEIMVIPLFHTILPLRNNALSRLESVCLCLAVGNSPIALNSDPYYLYNGFTENHKCFLIRCWILCPFAVALVNRVQIFLWISPWSMDVLGRGLLVWTICKIRQEYFYMPLFL